MPLVSIVMPTYNRADTILRAIGSVQAQTLSEWELIVVDDGSTDDTASRIAGLDPRLTLIRQQNQGTAGARNTGLRAARGAYVAFLDSDDEWLPHHLALSVAFLEAAPDEAFVSSELWEYFGGGRYVKHYRIELSEWYPRFARQIGSRLLDLPVGVDDDHLRVYEAREPVGSWGKDIVEQTPYQDVFRYRGRIFEHWRWGFLMCLQGTVLTRRALDAIGSFDAGYPIASDFGFLAKLCRQFPANYLSIPACIKHELASGGAPLREDHVATGKSAYVCAIDLLRWHEELFWRDHREDRELAELRRLRRFRAAQLAVERGLREEALRHLEDVSRPPTRFPRAWGLLWLVRLVRQPRLLSRLYGALGRASYAWGELRRGELTPVALLGRLAKRGRRARIT